jgi:hypothetical protein
MNDASLHELRAQARITYRYWHIFLMLRLREIETHLTQAERDVLGQVVAPKPMNLLTATLIEYDLLMGDETLPDIPLPPPLNPGWHGCAMTRLTWMPFKKRARYSIPCWKSWRPIWSWTVRGGGHCYKVR